DSLTLLKFVDIPQNSRIIDVGTGAGFPSIPLMIARNDIHITMLDGTRKRLTFIDEVVSQLGLNGETLHARAEEAGKSAKYREQFDFATARAVARLNVLSEYCLPFVKENGRFVAMKASVTDEIDEARGAIRLLGGKMGEIKEFCLPDGSERRLVVIKKISQTPPKYPRASAQIAKKALK
ncbi:MAG: 16S rRNA (guanine(527)-N(7))-methyltransferase RsmG, partial [Clostridia bacterium]|nr:16S rRNA (guanine(527)-N(7))-methyltransferase RsmG [Clostridia bacterium]